MRRESDLHSYQLHAIDFALTKGACCLYLGLGLGKTVIALTILKRLMDQGSVKRALIIAPLRVANSVWKQEAGRWDHLKDLSFVLCTGSLENRTEALSEIEPITVVNRENLIWLLETHGWCNWDAVIIDESTSFKDHSSQRFKCLRRYIPARALRILLSGTPVGNSPLNLWSQMYLCDIGETLGSSFYKFRSKHFYPIDFHQYKWVIKPGHLSIIQDKVKDRCLFLDSDELLNLPDTLKTIVKVEMKSYNRKIYTDLERHFIAYIENQANKSTVDPVSAANSAVLVGKLLQICNGGLYDERGGWLELGLTKLQVLKSICDENEGNNILLAYNFRSDLTQIMRALPGAKKLDTDPLTLEAWNRGEIPLLLAHPASAGHGLNLQFGGHIIVWFGLPWSIELYDQFNGRLHRQGQVNSVNIIHLLCQNSIEERVYEVLMSHKEVARDFMSAFRYSHFGTKS